MRATPLLLGLLLTGCPNDEPEPTPDVVVEVGTGLDAFEPLEEGQSVIMEKGPQGGWHITTAVRMEGLDPQVRIGFLIEDVDSGVAVTDYTLNVLMTEDEEGYVYTGMTGFLSVIALAEGELDTPPEVLDGHMLEIELTLTDVNDVTAVGSVLIEARRDPDETSR